ncbi:VWA domain-containing protein [Candidatus Woesearchaeota archaeon]|nr:VWA domain-containing protein [Candidatus Woesearchaeota archaeon]
MIAFKHPQLLYAIPAAAIILFFIIRRDFVRFEDYRQQAEFRKTRARKRIIVYFTRLLTISLLIAALAQPFDLRQQTIPGNPSLTILADNSDSTRMFDMTATQAIASEASNQFPVNLKTLAEGNRSAIGDSILANIQGDDSVLLLTDGNNNFGRALGDVMLLASSLNTTISAVRLKQTSSDALVTIEGPHETTADVENNFEVSVKQTGTLKPYKLTLTIDGEAALEQDITESKRLQFTKMLEEGYHQMAAQITAQDEFPENNRFLKTIKVQPKPKLLFVTTRDSPLSTILNSIYDVTTTHTTPDDISGYAAVIINDQKADTLPTAQLAEYALEGNGILVIGGKKSFDKDNYKSSAYKPYEALLPVTVGTGKEEPKKDVNVVLLIDVSGSTSSSFKQASSNTVEEVEKALAISVLKELKDTDNVGVIAFESQPHKITDLAKPDKKALEDKIARLAYGRGTDIAAGLSAAIDMLTQAHGSKNIILISDGITGGPPPEDVRMASLAAASGIKLYTIGVGERTDRTHMQDMATAGRGTYFEPTETQKIKIVLGESEKANNTYSIETINTYHFITKSISLKAAVTGYNFVIPKSQAQLLITTTGNEPILTAWRFGLGRIATLSTDDGAAWNAEMLKKQNSAVLTRTINWVIGDLSRNKQFDVQMRDAYLGEEVEISIISKTMPASPELNFTKTGERLYKATYKPQEPGFYRFFDAIVAVNNQKETSMSGPNPELEKLVAITNGQMFEPHETQQIIEKAKHDAKRIKTDSKSYSWILTIAALAAFLAEIAARRAIETKRINKQ